MARLVPTLNPDLAEPLSGGQRAELATLARLKRDLPQQFSLFHSVHWSNPQRNGLAFGEVDFVIVGPGGKVLLIEQKSGPLEEGPDGLYKRYGRERKPVANQITRSINNVKQVWREQHRSSVDVDYLLYLTDHRVGRLNGAALSRDRIVDAPVATRLAEKIQALAGGPEDTAARRQAERFFGNHYEIQVDIGSLVDHGETSFQRQAGALSDVVRQLEFTPFRLRIRGAAGCGKSVVALEQFRAELAAGRRPLYVCFNRMLADRVRKLVGADDGPGRVETFFSLCDHFLTSLGQTLDFPAGGPTAEFWSGVLDRILAADVPDSWRFTSIIVDEGQDFEPDWWEILQVFLRDDYRGLWLEDPHQNLYHKADNALPGWVTFNASDSLRSPQTIARWIREHVDPDFNSRCPQEGLGVGEHDCDDAEKLPKLLAARINALRQDGFTNDQIVILSLRGLKSASLQDVAKLGGTPLRRFTGEYTESGEQIMTDGLLLFDTIYRYKGGQAPAVILIDLPGNPDSARSRMLLHTAATRATARLELVSGY